MGRDSKFRIFQNRRKYFNWETKTKLKIIISSVVVIFLIVGVCIAANNFNFDKTDVIPIADSSLNEEIHRNLLQNVDIYDNDEIGVADTDVTKITDTDEQGGTANEEKDGTDKETGNANEQVSGIDEQDSLAVVTSEEGNVPEKEPEDEKVYVDDNIRKEDITFTCVGEIMMGANVTENLNYLYANAFKNIYKYTRYADFTYGILGTNITNLERISNVKSKYLVTKDIRSAFVSLGIDALNIATDHITDYDKTIFVTTIDTLKNNNIFMTGIKDSTLYVDVCGKKIAIISALSSYIGNKLSYEEFGINLYDEAKMNEDIINAKDNADFVVVDVSWGRDDTFGVTNQMNKIACSAIDSGADLVIGSNALGIYPIEVYKGVPIIYSTGYLITDSDYTLANRSYIWQFNINKDNKVSSINMIPVCTQNKTITNEFRISNPEICKEYNELINRWNNENGITSVINEDDTITVTFNR